MKRYEVTDNIITDPPYGNLVEWKNGGHISVDSMPEQLWMEPMNQKEQRGKIRGMKMIEVCLHCGNGTWNKYIEGQKIVCPVCGSKWDFLKFPLFFITGASGVGKTTAARILQRKTQDFIVLDADMFYNIMPHDTEEDALNQTEHTPRLPSG